MSKPGRIVFLLSSRPIKIRSFHRLSKPGIIVVRLPSRPIKIGSIHRPCQSQAKKKKRGRVVVRLSSRSIKIRRLCMLPPVDNVLIKNTPCCSRYGCGVQREVFCLSIIVEWHVYGWEGWAAFVMGPTIDEDFNDSQTGQCLMHQLIKGNSTKYDEVLVPRCSAPHPIVFLFSYFSY